MKLALQILTLALIAASGMKAQAQAPGRGQGGLQGWDYCTVENTFCQLHPGFYDIAYGANGRFVYKYGVQISTGFNCMTSTFNDQDPASGVQKSCYMRPSSGPGQGGGPSPGGPSPGGPGPGGAGPGGPRQQGPQGFDYCNVETSVCQVRPGMYDIAFGAEGRYVYKYGVQITNGFNCLASTFNDQDPISGIQKDCFTRRARPRGKR